MSVQRTPGQNGSWKISVGGSWTRYPATTAENRTLVRIRVSAGFTKSSVHLGAPVTIKGSIGPDAADRLVERQKYSGGTWTTVATTTTRTDGTFSMAMTAGARGDHTYRIKVSGSDVRANGYSPSFHLVVS